MISARTRHRKSIALAAILVSVIFVWQHLRGDAGLDLVSFQGQTMGTTYQIKLLTELDAEGRVQLHASIRELLNAINQQMSTYIEDSEISRFNRSDSTDWIEISHDFASVVKDAQTIHKLSQGAFDPTIMPLVQAWGFGPEQRAEKVPDPDTISRLLSFLGMSEVHVRLSPPGLRKERAEISIDLSAIAKGFGVDKIAEHLQDRGIDHFLVEIGGEMRSRGFKLNQQSWMVGIERPEAPTRVVQRAIPLDNASMATSGSYRNYFEVDGQRFSHTIDPRTGSPITHRLVSVSVFDRSCAIADAWATAMLVAGPETALIWANENDIPTYLLVMTDEGLSEMKSQAFRRHFDIEK